MICTFGVRATKRRRIVKGGRVRWEKTSDVARARANLNNHTPRARRQCFASTQEYKVKYCYNGPYRPNSIYPGPSRRSPLQLGLLLRLLHLHHVLHLHRCGLLLRLLALGLGHHLLRLQAVGGRVHGGRLIGRWGGGLAVSRRGLCLRHVRGCEWRGVLRCLVGGGRRDVPGVRSSVEETLVLAAGQKRETDRAVIARVLVVIPCRKINHISCRSLSVLVGEDSLKPFMFL